MEAPSVESLLRTAVEGTGAGWAALATLTGEGGWKLKQTFQLPPALAANPEFTFRAHEAALQMALASEANLRVSAGLVTWRLPFPDTLLLLGDVTKAPLSPHVHVALTGLGAGLAALLAANDLRLSWADANTDSRTDEIASLSQIGQAILGTLDMPEVLARLMSEIRRVVGVEAASILLWDEAEQVLTFTAADGSTAQSVLGLRVPAGQGVAGWVAQARLPAVAPDVQADPRWYAKVDEAIAFQSRSLICVPILRGEQLIGVLEAVNKIDGSFTNRDLGLVQALSNWAAEAIVNARAFETQRRQRQTAESVAQVAAIVGATLELPQVLARVLEQVMRVVDCTQAWIGLRAGDEMRMAASRSRPAEAQRGRKPGFDTGPLTEDVLRTRRAARKAAAHGEPARIVVPLAIGERVIGQIALERPAPDFGPEEAESISILVHPAATAIENAQLFAEATRRLQEMTILHEVALASSTTLDLDQLLRRTAQTLYHSMNYERVLIMMLEPAGASQILRLHPASAGYASENLRLEVPAGHGAVGRAAQSGQIIRVDDMGTAAGAVPISLSGPTMSQLCAPLMAADQVIGVMVLESSRRGAFSPEDEWLLTIVTRQLATALENSRLFAALRERAVNLTVLNFVARQMLGALEAGEIMRLAAAELGERFVYALAAVFMMEDDGRHLALRARSGKEAHRLPAQLSIQASEGIAGRVVSTGEVYVDNHSAGETIFGVRPDLGIGSELCAPILRDGQTLGILAVAHAHPGAFAETDVLTLEALAGMLGNALRSASLYADVQARMAELGQAQAQLVQSEKFAAIGRLTASIAHEVNNPLQSMHNCLQLASDERLPAERRSEYLAMAEGELLRLMEIVRRMLEFYRPGAAERAAVSVNWLVEDVLALAGKQIRDAGIRLNCHFSPDVHAVTVVTNPVRQVFLNLILNAVEAMPEGGTLNIATYNTNGEVHVRFEDSGPGVPPQDLSKVFEPFYTTKVRGTGLGLSVSYGILAAHGGSIAVDSRPGKGAAFTVQLPAEEQSALETARHPGE